MRALCHPTPPGVKRRGGAHARILQLQPGAGARVRRPQSGSPAHPEAVLQFDRDRLGARGDSSGTDCGFDTAAGLDGVASEVVWEKLRALGDGAARASRRLFR